MGGHLTHWDPAVRALVAREVAAAEARAWDEGYNAGQSFEAARHDYPPRRRALTARNPYRGVHVGGCNERCKGDSHWLLEVRP